MDYICFTTIYFEVSYPTLCFLRKLFLSVGKQNEHLRNESHI